MTTETLEALRAGRSESEALQQDPAFVWFMNVLIGGDSPESLTGLLADNLRHQPALLIAIRAWNAESLLINGEEPPADGLLGTAAGEALRMAEALKALRMAEALKRAAG